MDADCEKSSDCAESVNVGRKSSKGERFEELTDKLEKAQRHLRARQHEFRDAQESLAFAEDYVMERQRDLRRFISSTGGM